MIDGLMLKSERWFFKGKNQLYYQTQHFQVGVYFVETFPAPPAGRDLNVQIHPQPFFLQPTIHCRCTVKRMIRNCFTRLPLLPNPTQYLSIMLRKVKVNFTGLPK